MPRVARALLVIALLLAIGAGRSAAEPTFTFTEDGTTILYRARPGELPATVAEMFGIPARDLPAFLAANHIGDATRVGSGFVYRVPNPVGRALAERAATLEGESQRLQRALAEQGTRVKTLSHDADEARTQAAEADAHAARLVRLETLWPWAKLVLVVLVLLTGTVAYTASAAIRRQVQSDRFARTLARDLEDKRKSALADRQESARRVIELETRVRELEAKLGPRVVIGGRGTS